MIYPRGKNRNRRSCVVQFRRFAFGLADHERRDLIHQIVAVIGVDLQRDGLGEIQAEDAQNGFSIHDMAAYAQINVVRMAVDDVDKGFDVLSKAELDVDSFHY